MPSHSTKRINCFQDSLVLRMRGGSFPDFSSSKPSATGRAATYATNASGASLPRALELAVTAIERWWLVALLCIFNLEVAWRGGLLSLLAITARVVGIAFTLGRIALAIVLGAWAFEKASLAVNRGQRPSTRTALLTYPPFSVAR